MEEEEEDGYFIEPHTHPHTRSTGAPGGERETLHADLPEHRESETHVIDTESELERSHEMTEPQNQVDLELRENDYHSNDEQSVEMPEVEEVPPSPQSTYSGVADEEGPRRQWPSRERRAPKMFTYDQLGTPSCYGTAQANEVVYQYEPRLYTAVQPVTMWANPFQLCQLLQGY